MSQRRRARVLYVEDDECLHEIVAAVLAGDGFEVTSVGTVRDALQALEARCYQLLIADYHLPDGSGASLIDAAREGGLLWGVGVMLLTSEPRPSGVRGLVVLRKPIDCDALLTSVHGAIALRTQRNSGVRLRSEDELCAIDPPPRRIIVRG